MKKNLISLSLIGLLAATIFIPAAALGTNMTGPPDSCEMTRNVYVQDCPTSGTCSFDDDAAPCGVCCLMQTVYAITDWVFVLLVALTTVFVIWGAFKILTARDSDDEVKAGRDYIKWAAVGLLVAFMAKAVPQIVRVLAGVGN